jgi:hypothetical protein
MYMYVLAKSFRMINVSVRIYRENQNIFMFNFFFFENRAVYEMKLKETRNRPGVAQRVPGGLGSQIS